MDLIIKKADKNELREAILLSKKYCYKNTIDKNNSFILKPISEDYLNFLYVAKFSGKVIGVACARDFLKESYKRYGVVDDSRCKEIGKVTVDEKYRGMKVASKMIGYILKKFPYVNFYATIMEKPIENKASKELFTSLGFTCYKITDLFHEDVNLKEKVGLYVYESKGDNDV